LSGHVLRLANTSHHTNICLSHVCVSHRVLRSEPCEPCEPLRCMSLSSVRHCVRPCRLVLMRLPWRGEKLATHSAPISTIQTPSLAFILEPKTPIPASDRAWSNPSPLSPSPRTAPAPAAFHGGDGRMRLPSILTGQSGPRPRPSDEVSTGYPLSEWGDIGFQIRTVP
jgi:hypothetical protein